VVSGLTWGRGGFRHHEEAPRKWGGGHYLKPPYRTPPIKGGKARGGMVCNLCCRSKHTDLGHPDLRAP
jgi:hypothetical protein